MSRAWRLVLRGADLKSLDALSMAWSERDIAKLRLLAREALNRPVLPHGRDLAVGGSAALCEGSRLLLASLASGDARWLDDGECWSDAGPALMLLRALRDCRAEPSIDVRVEGVWTDVEKVSAPQQFRWRELLWETSVSNDIRLHSDPKVVPVPTALVGASRLRKLTEAEAQVPQGLWDHAMWPVRGRLLESLSSELRRQSRPSTPVLDSLRAAALRVLDDSSPAGVVLCAT